MKRRHISILAAIAIAIPSLASASVSSSPNSDLSIEVARTNSMNNLIKRINLLHKMAESYMLQTGDTNPTINKIDSLYNIKNIWLNYDRNGYMELSVVQSDTKNAIIIKNFVSPNEVKVANYIENSRRLDSLGVVNVIKRKEPDGTEKIVEIYVEFPFSPTLSTFINAIKNDIPARYPNGVISYTAPQNTDTWLKPDGNGNFIVYKNLNGKWNITGVYYPNSGFSPINKITNYIGPNSQEKVNPLVRVDSISKLKGIILPEGSLATDINGNMYVTNGKGEWYLLNASTNSANNFFQELANPIVSNKVGFYSIPGIKGELTEFSTGAYIPTNYGTIPIDKILLKSDNEYYFVKTGGANKIADSSYSLFQTDSYYWFLSKDNLFLQKIKDDAGVDFKNRIQKGEDKVKFFDADIDSYAVLTDKHIYVNSNYLQGIIDNLISKNIINPSKIKEVYVISSYTYNGYSSTPNNQRAALLIIKDDDTGMIINAHFKYATGKNSANYVVLNKKIKNVYFVNQLRTKMLILYQDGTADFYESDAYDIGSNEPHFSFVIPKNGAGFSLYDSQDEYYEESDINKLKNSLTGISRVLVGVNGYFLLDNQGYLKAGIEISNTIPYFKYLSPANSMFKKGKIKGVISNGGVILIFMQNGDIYKFEDKTGSKLNIKYSNIKDIKGINGGGFLIVTKNGGFLTVLPIGAYKFYVPYLTQNILNKEKVKKMNCSYNYVCAALTKENNLVLWSYINKSPYNLITIHNNTSLLTGTGAYRNSFRNVKDFKLIANNIFYVLDENGNKYLITNQLDRNMGQQIRVYKLQKNYEPVTLPPNNVNFNF